MRFWVYVEPVKNSSEPVYVIMEDKAILAEYWDYWCSRMRSVGKEHLINKENCILDWATIHWAQEATVDVLKEIISDRTASI